MTKFRPRLSHPLHHLFEVACRQYRKIHNLEGQYLCSVRTMYRILAEVEEVRERRNQCRHPVYEPVKKPYRNRKYSAWVGYNCVDRVISDIGKHDKRDRR